MDPLSNRRNIYDTVRSFFHFEQEKIPNTPKMMQIPIKAFSYREQPAFPLPPASWSSFQTKSLFTGTSISRRCPISSSTTTSHSPLTSGKKQNRPFLSVRPD